MIRRKSERRVVQQVMGRLKLRSSTSSGSLPPSLAAIGRKVVLARGLMREIGIYLFDEPTLGIDVC